MDKQAAVENQKDISSIFNSRLLMISSAVFMGVMGILSSFVPEVIAKYYNLGVNEAGIMFFKVAGALYLGFAALNWMARGNIIGGIYSRPVAFGNFLQFLFISILLLKFLINSTFLLPISIIAGINVAFAASFGYLIFGAGGGCGGNTCR